MRFYKEQLKAAHLVRMEPLRTFDLPPQIRSHDPELTAEVDDVQNQLKDILGAQRLNNDKRGRDKFISDMHEIAENQGRFLKRARVRSQELDKSRPDRRAIQKQIDDDIEMNLWQRSLMSFGRKRTSENMLAQSPSTRLSDAFVTALLWNANIEWPSGAQITLKRFKELTQSSGKRRSGHEQSDFRELLINTYSDPDRTDGETVNDPNDLRVWCPVVSSWVSSDDSTAAHILPVSLDANNIAYLLGIEWNQDEIWTATYSAKNGLMLHKQIERAFDRAALVIIPTETDEDGMAYQSVVLDHSMLKKRISGTEYVGRDGQIHYKTFADVHMKKLEWYNDNRPSATNLYVRYVLSRLSRIKATVKGWEKDIENIPERKAWAGVRPLRYGVLRRLAYEIGEYSSENDASRSSSGSTSTSVLDETPGMSRLEGDREIEHDVAIRLADRFLAECESMEDF